MSEASHRQPRHLHLPHLLQRARSRRAERKRHDARLVARTAARIGNAIEFAPTAELPADPFERSKARARREQAVWDAGIARNFARTTRT